MAATTERRAPRVLAGRLAFSELSRSAVIWGVVFALTIVASAVAYRSTYGTPAEREQLLRGIARNSGFRALFGPARSVDTVGGFLAWRSLSIMPLIAGVWGLLVGTRLLRGEEDRGRWETLISAPLARGTATLWTLLATFAGAAVIFVLSALAVIATIVRTGDASLAGALWFALAVTVAAPVFSAVGGVTSQIAASRREAAALAGVAFAVAYLVRVAADGSASLSWLNWLTPLGWIEEMRPLTGARPLAILPLVAAIALLALASVALSSRRDLGASLLARTDDRPPRELGLGSALGLTLRESLGGLAGWSAALALVAFVYGFVSKAVAQLARTSLGISKHVQSTIGHRVDIASAKGYMALVFVFLAVALSIYAVTHATAAREEEATGRLDTLLGEPLGRRAWLGGRIAVGLLCSALVAIAMALGAWLGGAVKGASITLPDMLQAAGNALPVVALFLGLAMLGFAIAPRHTGAIAFGSVGVAYLWQQTGEILKAPGWVLAPSPFHWLALVPSEPFDLTASVVMAGTGALAAIASLEVFRRRDLVGI
ncbi:MAG TPA: ABC transporter permease subunit [Solirubrobacteraceae bacterium]|nr:ABC transporter permease subunit [Solirubrobacteraceae bacterium]